MRSFFQIMAVFVVAATLWACSLPPQQPVTRLELMRTNIYDRFVIHESPEELLYALNTRGEVVVESKRKIPGKEFPVYVKLLATSEGVHVLEYDR
jgi:hypothetical protein